MKTYFSIFILILISCSVFAAEKTNLSDSEISGLLIGKWLITLSNNNNNTKLVAVDEYLPNGKARQKGILTVSNQHMNIKMESTWKVENGELISSLVSITPKGMMPVGLTTTDTVISIDKEKFILRDGKTGELQTYYRVGGKAGKEI